ncbi:probable galactinol--sucrose galactosyltransferase 2 [Zingiber officinale]|uniref:probable galactinol--sucrose galactosyltransferase 2 n=1 Tax=Zingiber officinale TaxID=94328 RepID=UPI001C4A76F1|nr:probable galactinol--sucrose galactosyltransferase 2 [Zingiber officinale]
MPSICLPTPNGHKTPVVFPVPSKLAKAMIVSFPPPLRLCSSFLCTNPFLYRHGSILDRGTTSKASVCLPAAAVVAPFIKDGALRINGREALTGVPENVVATYPLADSPAAFLGAVSDRKDSRHVFKLGVLRNHRLLCLFRFKIFWMVPRWGTSGSDVPFETQMLLLEVTHDLAVDGGPSRTSHDPTHYILFLPVLDGCFRSSLQGNSSDELEFCIESGDPATIESQFLESVFVNYGEDPFGLMKESMIMLEKHKGTFSVREKKEKPGILDWFGWCTWDAFYFDVHPKGIEDGLKSLSEGGTPPKFLLIDDGWQDTRNEFQKEGEPAAEGSQYGARLVSVKENYKFKGTTGGGSTGKTTSLKDFVTYVKETYRIKYVYCWHALMGYWGGVDPDAPETKKYNSKIVYPVQSPGNHSHLRDLTMDCMEKYGVGMIDPSKIFEYYDDQHSYLRSQNVDGVKVDVQNVLETIGSNNGGRVTLTRRFHQALEKSISRNFKDNSIICCMGHNTDSIYSSKVSSITRASDDYMPRNLSSQTLHVAAVTFNSIFLGEVMMPDWDMFYSLHYAAEFHATARAIGGCGVYISDKPNQHDFELLRKLVLPDGSVLRAKYPGRPTHDCLFNDPVMDGKSLLKIWNHNKLTGIVGIFNCQGAGLWPSIKVQSTAMLEETYLTGHVSPCDVEYLEDVAGDGWNGDCAVYSFTDGSLSRLPKNGSLDVSLKSLQSKLYTISPILSYNQKIQFAPIGLMKMYNSGGAIEAVDFASDLSQCLIRINGKGCGSFGAYSSIKPKICTINSTVEEFMFDHNSSLLTLIIPEGGEFWEICAFFEV